MRMGMINRLTSDNRNDISGMENGYVTVPEYFSWSVLHCVTILHLCPIARTETIPRVTDCRLNSFKTMPFAVLSVALLVRITKIVTLQLNVSLYRVLTFSVGQILYQTVILS